MFLTWLLLSDRSFCPVVFNVLLSSSSIKRLVNSWIARESGVQLRVKLLFFLIPLTPFKSFNILSPLNNQESEIGFVPPSDPAVIWGIIIVWITNAAGLVLFRSLWALAPLRTVPERRRAKNKPARHLMIKIAGVWEASDYLCAAAPRGTSLHHEQRERHEDYWTCYFSDEYLMDCAARWPRGTTGNERSGGRYRRISCRARGQSPPEYKWRVEPLAARPSAAEAYRGEHALRSRIAQGSARTAAASAIRVHYYLASPCGRVEANANPAD